MVVSSAENILEKSAFAQLTLAKIWHEKGKLNRAILGYEKVISIKPLVEAFLKLGELFCQEQEFNKLEKLARQALLIYPNQAEFHKYLVNALIAQDQLDEIFYYYQLSQKDPKKIDIKPSDILCCVTVRNESLRLPYFLEYYREKGVDKFLIIDNNSTDDTLHYLLQQPDVYTWYSPKSFNEVNFGSGWFEVLLSQYGINHWCLMVDTDELLYYPDVETKTIRDLCELLDRKQKRVFTGILLDMYSDKLIGDTFYQQGEDFRQVCPYFDSQFYHRQEIWSPYQNQIFFWGGARERLFGKKGDYLLSKVPLIKYDRDCILSGGQHWTNLPKEEIANETGCLLHFKYFHSFLNYIAQEVERKEHSDNGFQYQEYARHAAENQQIFSFYDAQHSLKLQNSQQLIELGIMKVDNSSEWQLEFPAITPLGNNIVRPFWSVMITVYNRTQYLARALTSVVNQGISPQKMQIEIIVDGGCKSVIPEIKAIINEIGGHQVSLYIHSENIGHPHIFNLAIERAKGQWVHLLHDDDWLEADFYQTLESGINQAPKQLGALFCRHIYSDENQNQLRLSELERKTSGILDNWLAKIATKCRLQCSAMVVKREVYEKIGGYCPQANSAFDWEMWKRIAVNYLFWYESQALAHFCEHSQAESDKLIKSGEQIADSLRTIQISQSYLPLDVVHQLSSQAKENLAQYGIDLAKKLITQGDYQGAFMNLQQTLKCSQSSEIKKQLVNLFITVSLEEHKSLNHSTNL